MEKLSEKQVDHVANLARLAISPEEKEKYGVQLASILTEIDKINKVNIDENGEILIAPTNNQNKFCEDEVGDMLTKDEIFKNAKHVVDGYVVVPKVLND